MRKKLYTIITICMLLCMYSRAQDTIRIMTINIDQGVDASLPMIGEMIRSYQPDLVALQEVDMHPNRSYATHQYNKNFIAELSYYADMQGVFGKAWDHPGGWEYGDAILSKYSFSKSENFVLKNLKGTEPRQLVMIHVRIKGHDICFASTHLCHENAVNRVMQLRQIKEIMQKQKEKIQFVCGDLNSDTSEDLVFTILKKWKDALPADEGTFSSDSAWHYKAHKYDYILYNDKKKIEVVDSNIYCDAHITDHCVGIVDIIIR